MIIAPSVLSFDYADFNNQLYELNQNADWLHFDVMDGHFVKNITFGPDILKAFRKNTSLMLDVHLMIDDPLYYSDSFAKAGADMITFHYEAYNDPKKCLEVIKHIRALYLKVGISIKPDTKVREILSLLPYVDNVLVMSVEPGFGGQSFIPSTLNKIKELDMFKKANNLNYHIEVDGGINDKTAKDALASGADALVAGSFIFKGNIANNIKMLRNCEQIKSGK